MGRRSTREDAMGRAEGMWLGIRDQLRNKGTEDDKCMYEDSTRLLLGLCSKRLHRGTLAFWGLSCGGFAWPPGTAGNVLEHVRYSTCTTRQGSLRDALPPEEHRSSPSGRFTQDARRKSKLSLLGCPVPIRNEALRLGRSRE